MIWLRFIDPDTSAVLFDLPVENFDLGYGLNQTTTWSSSIPLNNPGIETVFRGMAVEFYVDGSLFFEGLLQAFSMDIIKGNPVLAISGRSYLDNLYAYKSYPLSYYDQKPLLGILTEILLQAGWAVGDISTLDGVNQTLTKDMRGEKTLLTQLNKLLDGIPFTYWREGATRLGKRTLDIGLFNQPSGISAIMPDGQTQYDNEDDTLHTITSFQYSIDFVDAVYGVRVEGGNINAAGSERVVNLGDALGIDPLLRIDSNYPIIEDVNERVWSVVNLVDYPYPGGRILSSEDTLSNVITALAIGDTVGGAVESNVHIMISFVPYPGRLNHITIRLGVRDVSFGSELGSVFDIYWRIYEIDPGDNRTITAIVHHQVIPGAEFPAANMALILEPNTDIILESGKLYGLGIGTTVGPTLDVARQVIIGANRTSVSNTFFMRQLNIVSGTMPIVGSQFLAANFVPVIEVVTDPIGTIFAGFTTEKQQKFAPPKTGSASLAAEIQRAGYAAYQWGKQYLIEHPPIKKEYSLKAIGTNQIPRVGDQLYVKGRSYIENFDELSGLSNVELFEDVDGYLRITAMNVRFQNEKIEVDYTLVDGEGVPISEQILALYDETENDKPPEGSIWGSPWGLLLDTINVNIGPAMPNAAFPDGTDAFAVAVSIFGGSVASLPTNTEWVYLAGNPYGTSDSGILRIEVIEEPEFSNVGQVIFLVGFTTRGWQYGDEAALTVKLIWR